MAVMAGGAGAVVASGQIPFAALTRKLAGDSTNAMWAIGAVGEALLLRRAGPVQWDMTTETWQIHFAFPRQEL